MRYSRPRRNPIEHDKEIEKIARGMNISYSAAFQIWVRKMKGVKEWEKY